MQTPHERGPQGVQSWGADHCTTVTPFIWSLTLEYLHIVYIYWWKAEEWIGRAAIIFISWTKVALFWLRSLSLWTFNELYGHNHMIHYTSRPLPLHTAHRSHLMHNDTRRNCFWNRVNVSQSRSFYIHIYARLFRSKTTTYITIEHQTVAITVVT